MSPEQNSPGPNSPEECAKALESQPGGVPTTPEEATFLFGEKFRNELRARLKHDHTYHKPGPGQPEKYEAIRAKALEFALLIVELSPVSREQASALTKIEEAVFHANAAIARNSGMPDGR